MKGGISLKNALRIGLTNLQIRRVVVTVVLCSILLSASGIAINLAFNDFRSEKIRALMEEDYAIVKSTDDKTAQPGVDVDEYSDLNLHSGIAFARFISDRVLEDLTLSSQVSSISEEHAGEYIAEISKVGLITQEAVDEMGFTLHGRLPEAEFEIVIPECLYRMFQYGGYNGAAVEIDTLPGYHEYDFSALDPAWDEPIEDYDDVIGKKLCMNRHVENTILGGQYEPATVVGVIDTGCTEHGIEYSPHDAVFVSETDWMNYRKHIYGDFSTNKTATFVVGRTPDHYKDAETFYSVVERWDLLEIVSPNHELLNLVYQFLDRVFTVTSALSIVVSAAAVLVVFQFASIAVDSKRMEIAVLKEIGAGNGSIYKIFFSENLILAAGYSSLASLITYFSVFALNAFVKAFFKFSFSIVHFEPLSLLCVVAIGFTISFAASFFPIHGAAKRACIR